MIRVKPVKGTQLQAGTIKRLVRRAAPYLLRAAVPLAPFAPAIMVTSCDNPPQNTVPSYDFRVDPENVHRLIEEISARHRRVFTDGNRQTESYLENKLRDYLGPAADISRQPIEFSGLRSTFEEMFPNDTIDGLDNVVARIPGRDPSRKLIFTAHFDSRGEGFYSEVAPGANDNATGLAVLLEIARNLAGHEFPFDIELVAFNGEEMDKLGSSTYVQSLIEGDPSILGVINLDTLGGNLIADRLAINTDRLARPLADRLARINSDNSIVPLLVVQEAACASDECEFREVKVPAIMISENSGPAAELLYPGNVLYHTSGDTLDRLNLDLVVKAAELCLKFLEEISVSGDWQALVRPAIASNVETPFAFLVTLGAEDLFLTIQNEDATGLKYGILYDQQGNALYRLELSYEDENLGLIRSLSDGSTVGRVAFPVGPASGRLLEPVELAGNTVLSPAGEVIGQLSLNEERLRPEDITPPPLEVSEPPAEVLIFPDQGVLLRGRTEPGLAVFPSIITGNLESASDGGFASTLPLPFSLTGTASVTVRDAAENYGRQDLNYVIPSNDATLFGGNFRFYGAARPLQSDPNFLSAVERLQYITSAASLNYTIFIDPLSRLDFKGATTPEEIRVSLRAGSVPEELRRPLASVLTHESIHAAYLSLPGWSALYDQGKTLGTWELFDDSVFLNYISDAGHPKDSAEEGLASAGQAYLLFPQTFRRLIDILALPDLPADPFAAESLNRAVALIWGLSPDRTALRQNIMDIYLFLRDNCFAGQELETDI